MGILTDTYYKISFSEENWLTIIEMLKQYVKVNNDIEKWELEFIKNEVFKNFRKMNTSIIFEKYRWQIIQEVVSSVALNWDPIWIDWATSIKSKINDELTYKKPFLEKKYFSTEGYHFTKKYILDITQQEWDLIKELLNKLLLNNQIKWQLKIKNMVDSINRQKFQIYQFLICEVYLNLINDLLEEYSDVFDSDYDWFIEDISQRIRTSLSNPPNLIEEEKKQTYIRQHQDYNDEEFYEYDENHIDTSYGMYGYEWGDPDLYIEHGPHPEDDL